MSQHVTKGGRPKHQLSNCTMTAGNVAGACLAVPRAHPPLKARGDALKTSQRLQKKPKSWPDVFLEQTWRLRVEDACSVAEATAPSLVYLHSRPCRAVSTFPQSPGLTSLKALPNSVAWPWGCSAFAAPQALRYRRSRGVRGSQAHTRWLKVAQGRSWIGKRRGWQVRADSF